MTKITVVAAALLCAGAARAGNPPTIVEASINAATNQLTIIGQNLTPSPTVLLGVVSLTVVAAGSTKIVAALPASLSAGTIGLKVTVGTQSAVFVVTNGAQGPAGPAGPQGPPGTVTLPFLGQVTSNGYAFEVDQFGIRRDAISGAGGINDGSVAAGGAGLAGYGGAAIGESSFGGDGVYGLGGAPVVLYAVGGYGGEFYGGNTTQAQMSGGAGVYGQGGDGGTGGGGGTGGTFAGGGDGSQAIAAGYGVVAAGGNSADGTGGLGGTGIVALAGFGPIQGDAGLAGYFAGDVAISGNVSKSGWSFKIDDPSDPEHKNLYHSFVESPDMMNIYNGNVVTDGSGSAVVKMPAWFEALNRDFRYQLTVIGQPAQAWVATEIANGAFAIRTDRPGVKVSWQVTGVRQDAWANAHRIPLEVEKAPADQGHYLHPELFGHGDEPDIYRLHHPELFTKRPKAVHETGGKEK